MYPWVGPRSQNKGGRDLFIGHPQNMYVLVELRDENGFSFANLNPPLRDIIESLSKLVFFR